MSCGPVPSLARDQRFPPLTAGRDWKGPLTALTDGLAPFRPQGGYRCSVSADPLAIHRPPITQVPDLTARLLYHCCSHSSYSPSQSRIHTLVRPRRRPCSDPSLLRWPFFSSFISPLPPRSKSFPRKHSARLTCCLRRLTPVLHPFQPKKEQPTAACIWSLPPELDRRLFFSSACTVLG